MPNICIGDAISTNIFASYGSVGCFVRSDSDKFKGTYILTNGHVIADAKMKVLVKANTKVYRGQHNDVNRVQIGVVSKGLREWNHKLGYVDWALCQITNPTYTAVKTVNEPGLGLAVNTVTLTKWSDPAIGMTVAKRGATTGWQTGNLTDDDSHNDPGYLPSYPAVVPNTQGLVEVTSGAFCLPGDSGSVIYDMATKRIVALLFGSDGVNTTIALPIRRIFQSLKDKTKANWDLA
jgi:hypothetical protein